jgi:hypothetical protein
MPDTDNKQKSTVDSPPLGTPVTKTPTVKKVMPTGVDEQKEIQAMGTPAGQKAK